MSRIGKKSITLPAGVTVKVDEGNVVVVKGPKGELKQAIHAALEIRVENGVLSVVRNGDEKEARAAHGLYRTLISNLIVGVSEGYTTELDVIGVGFKAEATGQLLELSLGYSHLIHIVIPKEIGIATETKKGSPPRITLKGIDKQLVGHIASKIRSLRKPEPYKGKGVRLVGEIVRRKAGKAAAKK
jgi:large subunit ribosomal protein L6